MERINRKIGILGGGQLGKMLFAAGTPLGMDINVLDKNRSFPAGQVCHQFVEGDFTSYDDVIRFGQKMDVVTIEIEKINVKALQILEKKGVDIFPQPSIVETIQDKGRQKEFFDQNDIPTASYRIYEELTQLEQDLNREVVVFPFIQKMRREGYDGRGVTAISDHKDLGRAFDKDFLVEDKVAIDKELSVIVCRSTNGEVVVYDPVEMIFDPVNHILLYQKGPADVSDEISHHARELAEKVTHAFGIVGLLAIEMFLTTEGVLLVNEVAPRPHNSGHHTIEASICSQYENHLRAIGGWPLGSTATRQKSILVNLLGAPGYEGPVKYNGIEEVMRLEGVHIHLYGKTDTRPNRKMGHVTIVGDDDEELFEKYNLVTTTLKIQS